MMNQIGESVKPVMPASNGTPELVVSRPPKDQLPRLNSFTHFSTYEVV